MDDVRHLVDEHVKKHPKDDFVCLYRGMHLRNEEFKLADREFTKAFAAINDFALLERFRYSRVRARYLTGDVLGIHRDMPRHETFRQLADSSWFDKKAEDLAKLVDAHGKADPDDGQLPRYRWRMHILAKRFDEASKIVKAAVGKNNERFDADRFLADGFIYDMLDNGFIVEAYRHAPDPSQAQVILVAESNGGRWSKDQESIVAEHRRRFRTTPP